MEWGRVVIIAPHPDDEVIGAGGVLFELSDVWVVEVTDGAPRNMEDALRSGFATREEYARARFAELGEALRLAGIGSGRIIRLSFPDQELARRLQDLPVVIAGTLRGLQPDTVLTPSYEGGHPDHDSVAYAVQIARQDLPRPPRVIEYALYHAGEHGIKTSEFLNNSSASVETVVLSWMASNLKRQMLSCFRTQRATLAPFEASQERFRVAPTYNFERPPHAGRLYYENFAWGVTGEEWRALAYEATQARMAAA